MTQSIKPKRILIVDDQRPIRESLRQIVQNLGYEALVSERATRAISIVLEEPPDAMLLDIKMPGPHGDQLLRYLKDRGQQIPPTIVISGELSKEKINALIRLGVSGIITKPFKVERLMVELRRILEGRSEDHVIYCPECGHSAADKDTFCRQCGNNLERHSPCPRCQAECTLGDRFCANCGYRTSA